MSHHLLTVPLQKNILHLPVLLATPPFTQLNTPYPATAYLKGFLNTKHIPSIQADWSLEVILRLFSKKGLTDVFSSVELTEMCSENARRIFLMKEDYLNTINPVINFLQGKNPSLAYQICGELYLPEASRFNQINDLKEIFGAMGIQDKAKHLATLYLEDLADFIVECIDPEFGFSRYAEHLGGSARYFDNLYQALLAPLSFIDHILIQVVDEKIAKVNPVLLLLTVPFPGNLYAAFRIGQFIKKKYPSISIAMGGGFANTELRSLADPRVFDFFDFITLDDGELPVEELYKNAIDPGYGFFKRTFMRRNGAVVFVNNSKQKEYKQAEVGTPDYSDLPLDDYISVIEVANPMHRLWSDGRWNKLTLAHGCYWGKCTFCDISLDYIKIYEPIAAQLICDRIEQIIVQTGQTGFHFVDEAAPPSLMRALAIELISRKIQISWWTNIRFEKRFSADLCKLLRASGCIAVSGGLEVASNRLLNLIEKGVTVEQVAVVAQNFEKAGIMVHAYLMYGYPTQTVQETVDSLEMVRQLFAAGVLKSGFWHQFAMTVHSPVGQNPERFGVEPLEKTGSFANNDVLFSDKTGIDHNKFAAGLRKSLFNFMHGICLTYPLQEWFEFKIPHTTVPNNFIRNALAIKQEKIQPTAQVIFLGNLPVAETFVNTKKGKVIEVTKLVFHQKSTVFVAKLETPLANWLKKILPEIKVSENKKVTFAQFQQSFESDGLEHFELFWQSRAAEIIKAAGLLVV